MTFEQIKELVDGMTDRELHDLLYLANERVSEWDRPSAYTDLAQAAMAVTVMASDGACGGEDIYEAFDYLDEVIKSGYGNEW